MSDSRDVVELVIRSADGLKIVPWNWEKVEATAAAIDEYNRMVRQMNAAKAKRGKR